MVRYVRKLVEGETRVIFKDGDYTVEDLRRIGYGIRITNDKTESIVATIKDKDIQLSSSISKSDLNQFVKVLQKALKVK